MLDMTICAFTDELINDAIEQNVYMQPKAGTPLAELVKSSTTMPLVDLTNEKPSEIAGIIQDQSDNSMHNGWTNEIVNQASALLNKRIEIIKTVVIPCVKSIADEVLAEVGKLGDSDFNFNIVRYSVCDAVNIDSFISDVRRNTGNTYLTPDLFFSEPNKNIPGILEALKTGNKPLDDSIAVAVSKVGDNNLFRMWESLFVDRSKTTIADYMPFDSFVRDADLGLEFSIIIYQLAINLSSAQGASHLNATAKQYKEAAAFIINQKTNAYNKAIDSGILIRSHSNSKGCIEVFTVNYVGFLQKGGTAEMIIGAAHNKNHYYDSARILENAKEIEKDYLIVKAASSLDYRSRVREAVIGALTVSFMRSLKNEQSLYETTYFESHPGAMSDVIVKFENALTLVGADSVKDIYRKVCEILCFSRFYYVDCYDFMKTVDSLCENGDTPQDAFAQAVLGEISRFVVSQIKV